MTYRVLAWPVRTTRLRIAATILWVIVVLGMTSAVGPTLGGVAAVVCWIVGAVLVLIPSSAMILTSRRPATVTLSREGIAVGLVAATGEVPIGSWRWSEVGLRVQSREDGDTLSIRPSDGSVAWVLASHEGASLDHVVDAIRGAGGKVEHQ